MRTKQSLLLFVMGAMALWSPIGIQSAGAFCIIIAWFVTQKHSIKFTKTTNFANARRRAIMIRIILPVVFFAIALLFAVPVLVAAYVASAEAQARIVEEGEL